ncbi:MAG: 4Fe-4S binding protein [Methanosarcinales archaeon]|nr:4Fe-4S binding protein [ANME-2 cluster archaeon]MDW7775758.1 4Fe-4S binding protein [Methanosarcinales archaeon]
MADHEKLVWKEEICAGCGICERSCPSRPKAIVITGGKAFIDFDLCDACGICIRECPVKALSFEMLA